MQVFQDEQDGAGGRELGEHAEDRAEQLLLRQASQFAAVAGTGAPVREQAAEACGASASSSGPAAAGPEVPALRASASGR